MRHALCIAACAVALGALCPVCATMDGDPEAKALLGSFVDMPEVGMYINDPLDASTTGTVTGPVAFGAGLDAATNPADQAALFSENRVEAEYIYYGPYIPLRGHFAADIRVDAIPRDYNMMGIFSVGTGGNTCMNMRLGLDLRVSASFMTRRETVVVTSDPLSVGKWQHLELWYGPEGAVLLVDDHIEDYSTDYCVPYAHDASNAFYLGDEPWWEGKVTFYPLDSFVGRIDNLQLSGIKPGGNQ